MGIFSRIKEKLFSHADQDPDHTIAAGASTTANANLGGATTSQTTKPSLVETAEVGKPSLDADVSSTLAGVDAQPQTSTQAGPVDVGAIMDAAVKKNGQELDWRRSIVDTMKALDLDSSLASRKELADELGYTGDKNDSASMNIWLHKALMKALAENGGKVPAELLD